MSVTLPVQHLSFSMCRSLLTNPYIFKRRYIDKDYEFEPTDNMIIGSAFHKFAELKYQGEPYDKALLTGQKIIPSELAADYLKVVTFFENEAPNFGEFVETEVALECEYVLPSKNVVGPLKLKAVSDIIYRDERGLVVCDWKTVSSFESNTSESPSFILQALFNYYTVAANYHEAPYKFVFWQIKKSKNKDGSPQLKAWEIDFKKCAHYHAIFEKFYIEIFKQLSTRNVWTPNFFDFMNGKESFEMWTQESLETMPNQQEAPSPTLPAKVQSIDDSTIEGKIISKYREFGFPLQFVEKIEGPSIIQYRFDLIAKGVPISKAHNYLKDIQALAKTENVRIVTPVKGTEYVGIEIPRVDRVSIEQPKIKKDKGRLMLAIGREIDGTDYMIDLKKAPHLLVAGATGAGKSVFITNCVNTLLTDKSTSILILDPKREFGSYRDRKNVIVEMEQEQMIEHLEQAVNEMEKRYREMDNDPQYNPNNIVIIVDELTDLFMTALGKVAQHLLIRLAQKARAANIHLIVATQNPLSKTLHSDLKANLPTRVCFRVASQTNSKVVLDQAGAEKLLGEGDLLLMTPLEKGFVRLQGYFNQ